MFAQAIFTASVTQPVVGKEDVIELRFTVINAKSITKFTPPSLKGFKQVSSPVEESGSNIFNNQMVQFSGIVYLLRANTTGNFVFGSATVIADGKTLQSKPVKIKVVKQSDVPQQNANGFFPQMPGFDLQPQPNPEAYTDYILKKGETVQGKVKNNLFIKVETDKQTCFIGEPIQVTYKLFTRLKTESNLIRNPAFNGFSVIDLPNENQNTAEKMGSTEYNVYTLRKVQLYPLQAGKFELESAEVNNQVYFLEEGYAKSIGGNLEEVFSDFARGAIGGEGIIHEAVTLTSTPVVIEVKALPAEPDNRELFKGAVGDFTLEAQLAQAQITTDDEGILMISISGNGNMPLVNMPEIKWPSGIETYEPKVEEALNKSTIPVSGIKKFIYPFTISTPGTYALPVIHFRYFNPVLKRYVTDSIQQLKITVIKGDGTKKRTQEITNKKTSTSFTALMFTNRWIIIVPVILIVVIGLMMWLRKEKNQQKFASTQQQLVVELEKPAPVEFIQRNLFLRTEQLLQEPDSKAFYTTINSESKQMLCEKLNLPITTSSAKAFTDAALQLNVQESIVQEMQALLSAIEASVYAPEGFATPRLALYEQAITLSQKLETIHRA
ncbi:MAG: BatD family protein [Ferruginibacter sp.]